MTSSDVGCIIDIGGCVGVFTDHCLQQYHVGHIYVFEPLRVNYDCLVTKYRNHPRVTVFRQAVSNFNGRAPLYKKRYTAKRWGLFPIARYDFVGNGGSSLKDKNNVSKTHLEWVDVVNLPEVCARLQLGRIDLLKIDNEGCEYDILNDICDFGLYRQIDRIYFEDHTRKVLGLEADKRRFLEQAVALGLENQIFVQDHTANDPLKYLPYTSMME